MRRLRRPAGSAIAVGGVLIALGAGAAEKRGEQPTAKSTPAKREKRKAAAERRRRTASAASPMSFELVETPMTETVSHLQTLTGLNIILHPELAEANPAITLRVRNMRLGSALNWICRLADARYVLMDEAIYIIPKDKVLARERTVVVDVRDLTAQVRDFPGPTLTLGNDTEGQSAIGLAGPEDGPESDPSGELTMIVERALSASGREVSVEERNGRLIITLPGEK